MPHLESVIHFLHNTRNRFGNSPPIPMTHLKSAIYCLHKTRNRSGNSHSTPMPHLESAIHCLYNTRNRFGNSLPTPCRIWNQQSIACTKPGTGLVTHFLFPCLISHLESAIRCLHKTMGSSPPIATPHVESAILAYTNKSLIDWVTHSLFPWRISNQRSIACTNKSLIDWVTHFLFP